MEREGKIEVKKIENPSRRLFTFDLRRNALLELADELSIICDAQIAIIIFSDTGRLFEFSRPSSGMEQILLRRGRGLGSSEVSEEAESSEVEVLKNEIAELKEEGLLLSSIIELQKQSIKDLSEINILQEQCAKLDKENREMMEEELQRQHQSRDNLTLPLFPCPAERKNSTVQDNALTRDVISGNSSVAEDEESENNVEPTTRSFF